MKRINLYRKLQVSFSLRIGLITWVLLVGCFVLVLEVAAQGQNRWSAQRTVPMYHPETDPPILIADQSGTVHAFSSQHLGELGDSSERAVVYNQWTAETGWTPPVDILLSPIKNDARLLDVTLDESGVFHLIFFGGDETEANIYYSKAPVNLADFASAWSKTTAIGQKALVPENGEIVSDDEGNLIAIFSGYAFGPGWYTVTSTDSGTTWSEAEFVFPVYEKNVSPFYLQTIVSEDGRLHAVWSLNDINNYGLAVYYSNYDFDAKEWTDPLVLAEQSGAENLGTQTPIIIEHKNNLFVMFYDGKTNQQYFINSSDGGQTWSKPYAPFPHIGMNGPAFFAVDSNDDLHLFWGERLSGTHGMWHSTWQESGWSDFEAIVSGPLIEDKNGFNAFDPVSPHVAISEGNRVLVTWRSDYGLRANGVWYSTTVLDAPRLPVSQPVTISTTPEIEKHAEEISIDDMVETTDSILIGTPDSSKRIELPDVTRRDPVQTALIGLVPVILMILVVIVFQRISRSR